MARVFFSYSHHDESLRDQLEKHLSALKREGLVETWHDRRIIAGSDLDKAIMREVETADVILLLVSSDFLSSDYCYTKEMQRAFERHKSGEAKVIPVILRPCDWQSTPLGSVLAAPKDGRPVTKWPDVDDAFLDVVKAVRAALPEQSNPQPLAAPTLSRSTEPVRPRSSNLRLRKTFSQADQDRHLEQAFEYMANFFRGSLTELQARNPGIETSFRRIDANRFTAVIYRNGDAVARCKITLGGAFGRGITYLNNDQGGDNSMNESLTVESDDQTLFLKPLGMSHFGNRTSDHLSMEGAAEYYWSMLIEPLQR